MTATAEFESPSLVWDSSQRHTGRPWHYLFVFGVLMTVNIAAVAFAPFVLANSDDPVAVWIALAMLVAMTLRVASIGLLGRLTYLERVTLGSTGMRIMGAKLTRVGTAYRQVASHVAWGDVRSVEVDEAGDKADRGAVAVIELDLASPFGTEIRLVCVSRTRAEAFAREALALRAQALPIRTSSA